MGKRGSKPKGKVKIRWSAKFAYAIGLLVTDGNLSSNKRSITLVSNDREQLVNFKKCLGVDNKISKHNSGSSRIQKGKRVQFGDVLFFRFLESIGITSKKSLTIGKIEIPKKYFFDFLRGHFDGDGCFYSYWDPRWRSSFMIYIELVSASKKHILWLQEKINSFIQVKGKITKSRNNSCYRLKYAKKESLRLVRKIYCSKNLVCLSRKRLKIIKALGTIGLSL